MTQISQNEPMGLFITTGSDGYPSTGTGNTTTPQDPTNDAGTVLSNATGLINQTVNVTTPSTNSLLSGTGTLDATVAFPSYSAALVYAGIPDFIKQNDALNAYVLYYFIYGVCQILDKIDAYSRDNIGANGVSDLANFAGAPGWSQVLDTGISSMPNRPNRVPEEVMPWLGQFVGVRIDPNSSATKAQKLTKIQQHSAFQRGTASALVSALAASINTQLTPFDLSVLNSQIIVLEQTKFTSGQYAHDDYSITILVPSYCFKLNTYQQLETLNATYDANGNIVTNNTLYSDVETYVQNLGGSSGAYSGLNPNVTPSTDSALTKYLTQYRPAGMQIYIGGY